MVLALQDHQVPLPGPVPETRGCGVLEVDADECEELVRECKVDCIPTFQFYRKEEKVGQFSGALHEKLETLIAELK